MHELCETTACAAAVIIGLQLMSVRRVFNQFMDTAQVLNATTLPFFCDAHDPTFLCATLSHNRWHLSFLNLYSSEWNKSIYD